MPMNETSAPDPSPAEAGSVESSTSTTSATEEIDVDHVLEEGGATSEGDSVHSSHAVTAGGSEQQTEDGRAESSSASDSAKKTFSDDSTLTQTPSANVAAIDSSSGSSRRGTWAWIQQNCVQSFTQAFHAQVTSELLSLGLNIIPVLPIWNYVPFGTPLSACQNMTDAQYKAKKLGKKGRSKRRSGDSAADSSLDDDSSSRARVPSWRRRVVSSEGMFVIAILVGIVAIALSDTNSSAASAAAASSTSRRTGANGSTLTAEGFPFYQTPPGPGGDNTGGNAPR